MGKSYNKPEAINSGGDVIVMGAPVLVAQATASDIAAPGSGAVLSTDGTATSQLNVKTAAGSVGLAPTGVVCATSCSLKIGSTDMFKVDATKLTLPGGLTWTFSDTTPEGAVTAIVGSLHTDKTAGKMYLKTLGTGNTGWTGLALDT